MTEPRDLLVEETASNAAAPGAEALPPANPVEAGAPARSQWRDVWRQFRSHRGAMVALVLFVASSCLSASGR